MCCVSQKQIEVLELSVCVKLIKERKSVMKKTLSLTNKEGEVRELTADDLSMFKSAKEVLPQSLQKKLGVRGPQKAPKKIATTIRLSAEVLETFKATGDGWQTRIDASLRQFIIEHPLTDKAQS
jgi:uncharacterized protein (DUF4415 family)